MRGLLVTGTGILFLPKDKKQQEECLKIFEKVMDDRDPETGEERWRYRIAEMYEGHTGSDDGPISTPAIEAW